MLSPMEFSSALISEIDKTRHDMSTDRKGVDSALLCFLLAEEKTLKDHYLSTWDYVMKAEDKSLENVWYGFSSTFHKAFRQIDVLANGHLDMTMWWLLNSSDAFTQCVRRVLITGGYQ